MLAPMLLLPAAALMHAPQLASRPCAVELRRSSPCRCLETAAVPDLRRRLIKECTKEQRDVATIDRLVSSLVGAPMAAKPKRKKGIFKALSHTEATTHRGNHRRRTRHTEATTH